MANPLNLKVGDKVRLNLDAPPKYRKWFCGQDILEVAEVDEIDSSCTYRLKSPGGDRWWVRNESILGKAGDTPSTSAHTFKVDDKVRVINHRPSNADQLPTWTDPMDSYAGKVGTVVRIADSIVSVRIDDNLWHYRPEWLIPEPDHTPIARGCWYQPLIPGVSRIMLGLDLNKPSTIKSNIPLIETNELLTIKLE